MKKFFKSAVFLFIVAVLFSSCGKTSNSKIPDDAKIIKDCIFKTADEKYGIQLNKKIIFDAEYDTFETVGQIGDKTLYALGKNDGVKPVLIENSDGQIECVGEESRTLYEIFFDDGTLLFSIPFESYEFYSSDGYILNASLEGSLYSYEFSENGEIIADYFEEAGETGNIINGLYEVQYYYGASTLTKKFGLIDEDKNEVLPIIYSHIDSPFKDRIVAKIVDGQCFPIVSKIFDLKGNMICEKYNQIDFFILPETGKFIGIAYCGSDNDESGSICRDENGEIMPSGYHFIDKDGTELSEVFINSLTFSGNEISENELLVEIIDANGIEHEINLNDFSFEP